MIERSGGVERVSKKGQIQGEMLSKIIVCVFCSVCSVCSV
jgi:hypothetical protein